MLGFFPSMTFGEDISFPESFDIFVVSFAYNSTRKRQKYELRFTLRLTN